MTKKRANTIIAEWNFCTKSHKKFLAFLKSCRDENFSMLETIFASVCYVGSPFNDIIEAFLIVNKIEPFFRIHQDEENGSTWKWELRRKQ